jgi:hypothetical protein
MRAPSTTANATPTLTISTSEPIWSKGTRMRWP